MKKSVVWLAVVVAVAAGALVYLFLRSEKQFARFTALRSDLEALQNEVAELAVARAGDEEKAPAVSPATAAAAGDLADQVLQLAGMVERLEQTAQSLDERITRSRLAVPSDEERKAQIERAQARLDELRKTANEARAKARALAQAANVEIDERRLLQPGAYPALEQNQEFVAARNAAAAQERVAGLFEEKLTDLHFSNVLEALPPQEGR